MKTILVNTLKPYNIYLGKDILDFLGKLLKESEEIKKAIIITDKVVNLLYADRVESSLELEKIKTYKWVISEGEGSKNISEVAKILDFLALQNIGRKDLIIALGGGVVGDLAGFVAGIYMRGISYVQIPTTLLAFVDSSIGGKTAIDLPRGKNLAGLFWQPKLVLADWALLFSLPQDIFNEGISEIVKYGIIKDEVILDKLERENIFDSLEELIYRCINIKKAYVEQDEFDLEDRHYLNFGHTVGHALENLSNYSLSHGKAVGLGMLTEIKISDSLGLEISGLEERIKNIFLKFDLPINYSCDLKALIWAMVRDKKNQGELITFIFPKKIGECEIYKLEQNKVYQILLGSSFKN